MTCGDFYRPCAVHRLGRHRAGRIRWRSTSLSSRRDASVVSRANSARRTASATSIACRIVPPVHAIDSRRAAGWWRAVNHATFALESFIDELAEKAGKDPYEYRTALIDRWVVEQPRDSKEYPFNPERFKAVLKLAAEKAGWGQPLPAGHALGIAQNVPDHLTYAAELVEASVTNGKVNVHRVVVAVDSTGSSILTGHALNSRAAWCRRCPRVR
jgi:isoquinoline 1-oxidoreductase beta subunit